MIEAPPHTRFRTLVIRNWHAVTCFRLFLRFWFVFKFKLKDVGF